MKLEMNDDAKIAIVLLSIVVALTIIVCVITHETNQIRREAFKAGLVEKQNAGSQQTRWDKP